ncbi:class I SAM-dependent methyltransferase [Sphingomonas sp. NBWT7]|uniref:class I SAM-dependent methyltransferase n=1 Tax=Sphingomonas sp. NBWT7 TaxID=2596913 RepID=UPI00162607AF|nr:class I SAM-dependent methyltransferase [Sphingomonas sp. NBWT7]QNE33538.1 class I SAM-dependent methyltransferase [Sphingomonas sp. NBWT7]
MAAALRSPITGRPLVADTPHSLAAPGERWPVVDGIPYLRIESEGLVAVALDHLDAGCPDDALVALLTDQDAWWTGPATDLSELKHLVRERDTLSLREAMALLRMGPVADYFAYRWVDPTYLAGLALIEAHWTAPATAFELACGIGHYLRDLSRAGVACVGGDVVFAKCWLAKHWVAPAADYVVFDASAPWPIADRRFDLVLCNDAFYFLPDQLTIAQRLRAALVPDGVLAVSHLHNADYHGGSKGPARGWAEWAALFPDAAVYDERALLGALLDAREPQAQGWRADPDVEAWSIVEPATPTRALTGGLTLPAADTVLRPNPLIGDASGEEHVSWPSPRWRDEYGTGCFWAKRDDELIYPADPVRLRRLVDLPERW